MEEKWKPILNYEDRYEISSIGRVKSLKHKTVRMLKQEIDRYGYCRVSLYKNGKEKKVRVHRLVADAFIFNPNNYPEVNHIDGNKENNSVENLEWVTKSQNLKHAYDIGIKKVTEGSGISYGEHNGMHKLTEKEVDEIRRLYVPYDPMFGGRALSRKYGVSNTAIRAILNYKTWTKNNEVVI